MKTSISSQTFLHGGRIGDCIYALYTVRALGGGTLFLNRHSTPGWGYDKAMALLPLLRYQSYITDAQYTGNDQEPQVYYNLIDAERKVNPEDFPEWHGQYWPGNVHIAKRYAHHFGVDWKPGSVWLTAPKTKDVDVVFHAPMRRTTDAQVLGNVKNELSKQGINIQVIGGADEYAEFGGFQTKDMLEAADWINSAKCFLGAVSSCHAIAEGLGKPRLVQQAQGCDNVNSTDVINDWSEEKIIDTVRRVVGK